ncbi:hypothetical protein KUCAC02_005186 [Chaenocephalus aceratus]|uniref:Uncharacterized protein n=1 Tax=Chaenocephalus aceratus TaxID=36190 RepID=A0ACB9WMW6_CHAAC|nr:hypothetical protein KUCAC02_005186 [Chaenocephalus aceratus]
MERQLRHSAAPRELFSPEPLCCGSDFLELSFCSQSSVPEHPQDLCTPQLRQLLSPIFSPLTPPSSSSPEDQLQEDLDMLDDDFQQSVLSSVDDKPSSSSSKASAGRPADPASRKRTHNPDEELLMIQDKRQKADPSSIEEELLLSHRLLKPHTRFTSRATQATESEALMRHIFTPPPPLSPPLSPIT